MTVQKLCQRDVLNPFKKEKNLNSDDLFLSFPSSFLSGFQVFQDLYKKFWYFKILSQVNFIFSLMEFLNCL